MEHGEEPCPLVAWSRVGEEGLSPKGISAVVRLPVRGSADTTERCLISDFFTYNGTATILAHRLLPSQVAKEEKTASTKRDVESCRVSITAASASDSGVTALASAETEAADAPVQLFVGLTNGQLWQMEMKQQQDHRNSEHERGLPRRLSVSSKQLLCCRMAEPIDMICCYVQGEGIPASVGAQDSEKSSTRYALMLIALYSDGVAVVSWPETSQTKELPLVVMSLHYAVNHRSDRCCYFRYEIFHTAHLVAFSICVLIFAVLWTEAVVSRCHPKGIAWLSAPESGA